MSLIAMAVYDTEENKRTEYTEQTLLSLRDTVNLDKHELFIIDNNSCKATKDLYDTFVGELGCCQIIPLRENIGTARAINKAWRLRNQGQHCIKMDNDVVIKQSGWVEDMELAIATDKLIGQVGLKRKDCWEFPGHLNSDFRSELVMLPHIAGGKWQIVEKVKHVIGTCVMHSSDLLDRVGYLYQLSLYGYDDVIMSHRSHIAGYYNCFLPHIEIDHIDTGETAYQGWKEKHSGEQTQKVIDLVHSMYRGEQSIYYEAI
jgi:GT2 family glycosyltransferase